MGRKLRLDLDSVLVESFVVGSADGDGTVHGLQETITGVLQTCPPGQCIDTGADEGGGGAPTWASCVGMATCPKTHCGGPTCGTTCHDTCGVGCSRDWCPHH